MVGDRLGGHIVQAHVDGVGRVEEVSQREDARLLNLRVPGDIARVTVSLGSITVDGVSLTVNGVDDARFEINVIPHTRAVTTFRHLAPRMRVNLEVDMLARYVERILGR
jgi:riboflavin synthase